MSAVVFVLVTLMATSFLSAPTLAHIDRMYANGGTAGSDWGGGYAQWDYQALWAADWSPPDYGFILQTLWVGTRSSAIHTQDGWMEVGDVQGWQGQNVRTYYWAEGWPNHYYEEPISRSYPGVGTYVPYQIQAVFDGEYDAYIGGTYYASSFQPGRTNWVQTGLEATSYSSTAATSNFFWMQYRSWACCSWFYWANGEKHNDFPAVWNWITNFTHGENHAP
jgi:hypothetical protein